MNAAFQHAACKNGLRTWAPLLGVGQAQMQGCEYQRAFAFNCSCWQGGHANTFGLSSFPPFPFLAVFAFAQVPMPRVCWRQPGKLNPDFEGHSKPFWEARSLWELWPFLEIYTICLHRSRGKAQGHQPPNSSQGTEDKPGSSTPQKRRAGCFPRSREHWEPVNPWKRRAPFSHRAAKCKNTDGTGNLGIPSEQHATLLLDPLKGQEENPSPNRLGKTELVSPDSPNVTCSRLPLGSQPRLPHAMQPPGCDAPKKAGAPASARSCAGSKMLKKKIT